GRPLSRYSGVALECLQLAQADLPGRLDSQLSPVLCQPAAITSRRDTWRLPTRTRIRTTARTISTISTEAYAVAYPYSPTSARPTMLTVAMSKRGLVRKMTAEIEVIALMKL